MDPRDKVTHCGWFAFEGFGRPFEGWTRETPQSGYTSVGRAFTYRGAQKKARHFKFPESELKSGAAWIDKAR